MMNRSSTIDRILRIACCGLVLFTVSGRSTQQIVQESNRAADETVFNHDKTATQTWDPDKTPELNLPDVQAYVKAVGERLAKFSKWPGGYRVRVTDDPLVNGAAEIGSNIVITRGMLNSCLNEAELVGYIGHEIGHLDLDHLGAHPPKRSLWRRMVDQGLQYVPDTTGAVSAVQKHAEDMRQARFSQQKEQEADEYGATLASKTGYDPYALADLFQRLADRVDKNPLYRLDKLKGSHKALDARAQHLRGYLNSKKYTHRGELARVRYQQSLQSLAAYEGAGNLDPAAAAKLGEIRSHLKQYENSGQKLPAAEFLKIMRQLAEIRRGVPPGKTTRFGYASAQTSFMEEAIFQSLPAWASGPEALQAQVDGLIKIAGHLALGIAVPEALVAVSVYEAVSGRDFILDQPLGNTERMLAGAVALAGAGAAVGAVTTLMEESAMAVEASGISVGETTAEATQIVRGAEKMAEGIRASPTLRQIAETPDASRADFYVRPNGDVIPATGYRYLPSTSSNLSQLERNGMLLADENGTYISFNHFDQAANAASKLQLPAYNDGAIRVDFDTRQILEDVKIPRGKWGTADYLEPLTKDNPQWGQGGGTQAITTQPIQVTRIVDLRSGEILYGSR